MRVIGSPAASMRRRREQARLLAPGGEGEAGLLHEEPRERAWRRAGLAAPVRQRARARRAPRASARQMRPRRASRGMGRSSATVGQRRDLVEDQRHEPAGGARLVVGARGSAHARRISSRRSGETARTRTAGQPAPRGVLAHVERAHGDVARHADLVGRRPPASTPRAAAARPSSPRPWSPASRRAAAKMSWARSW